MVITMASNSLLTPPWVAHAKPPGTISFVVKFDFVEFDIVSLFNKCYTASTTFFKTLPGC